METLYSVYIFLKSTTDKGITCQYTFHIECKY